MRIFEGYRHGINLGGWISQCGQPDQRRVDTYLTEADIRRIKAMGLDHVRLPVDYFFLETEEGQPIAIGEQTIDQCVSWCRDAGLSVLLDLHKAYGYTFDPVDRGADRTVFFHDEGMQARFIALWRRLSKRYGKCPNVAFDLLNEIVSPQVAEEWNGIIRRTVRAIRENAPDTWIVVGGARYNHVTSVPELDAREDDRIVYNFHSYDPMVFTHQGARWVRNMPRDLRMDYPGDPEAYRSATRLLNPDLADDREMSRLGPDFFEALFAPAIAHAEKSDVPLYCGEYGVIDLADPEATLRWLRDITAVFDRHGIGRALWTYKRMDFGLIDEHYDPIRKEMLKLM